MIYFCGLAQAAQPVRFSDFFSGRIEMGVAVDPIDTATGIRLYEGLGGNTSLTIVAKKSFGYFPAGTRFSIGYRADVEGINDNPLSKIFSVGAGWTSGDDLNMPQIAFGVDRLDLHEFGDAIQFHVVASKPIWNSLETYYVSAAFHLEGTAPISGDECLRGANAGVTLRCDATADECLRLVQEIGAGLDDGSYGYPPAGVLSYAIYGKFAAGDWELIFPRLTGVYANENGGDYEIRRDEKTAMLDFAAAYKF